MKKRLASMLLCGVIAVSAVTVPRRVSAAQDDVGELIEETITSVEADLEGHDTDVITELEASIASYEDMLSDASVEDGGKIEDLIDTTQKLLDEFRLYKNPNGIKPRGGFHLIWSPAVAAIVAVFWMEGWYLAAELLLQAKHNNIPGSHYEPVHGQRVANTSHIRADIAIRDEVVGSGKFENSTWEGYVPIIGSNPKCDADAFTPLKGSITEKHCTMPVM